MKVIPKVIYVYSGKGGVGKSTICINLAFALSSLGYKVGVFDADLSSPSIPNLTKGLQSTHTDMTGLLIQPHLIEGVLISSTGFLTIPSDGTYLTGQYLKGALYQMFFGVDWDVDYLFIDMPPGTSEIHGELFYNLKGSVLLVSTPHITSYEDVERSIDLIERFNLPIIGLIENMTHVFCDHCGHEIKLFPNNATNEFCKKKNISFVQSLEFNPRVNEIASNGIPIMCLETHDSSKEFFFDLANKIRKE